MEPFKAPKINDLSYLEGRPDSGSVWLASVRPVDWLFTLLWYRVTHHVDSNLLLTPKPNFRFSMRPMYQ